MSEVTQTIMVGDGSGREGNCLQAAVASLLDLPLGDVPHFLESPDYEDAIATFAAEHGYELWYSTTQPPKLGLAYGPSQRGVTHAVVYRDGKFEWDPHPERSGLLRADRFVHFERSAGAQRVSGRDAARDELALMIAHPGAASGMEVKPDHCDHCRKSVLVAAAIQDAGYRKVTVTPEQLLAVVQILDDVPAVRFPETWMRKARDIARAFGLSVAEDGGQ